MTFDLVAIGDQSDLVAKLRFTDGSIKVDSLTLNPALESCPQVTYGSGASATYTVTAHRSGEKGSNGNVKLIFTSLDAERQFLSQ